MKKKMAKQFLLMFIILLISSCSYYIPKRHVLESNTTYYLPENNSLNSEIEYYEKITSDAINSESFEIMSWNTLAGCRSLKKNLTGMAFCCNPEKWKNAFLEFASKKDIILLQEAYLDQEMINTIKLLGPDYKWNMATSFIADQKFDIPTGVMTIAKYTSQKVYALREYEPVFPTPKASLFTEFNLKSDHTHELLTETLLVVNVHAILMGDDKFQLQLKEIKKKIKKHKGPIILAGDFNTMTSDSTRFLTEKITEGFEPVTFDDDKRKKSFFGYPYDFIFYKGLKQLNSKTIDLSERKDGKVSDHNPLIVRFKVD